jgi:hypothetical protein
MNKLKILLKKIDFKLIWDSTKEPLREIIMAALPGILVYLKTIDATWATALYLSFRWLDSFLHEKSKANPTKVNKGFLGLKGIVGF